DVAAAACAHRREASAMDNRRIVVRVRPDALGVLWCLPGTVVGHRRERKRPPTARVIDISHTGMQVAAPTDDRIVRGVVINVVINDVRAPVRVRWSKPTTTPGWSCYGVEFVRPDAQVEAAIIDVIRECSVRDGIELREEAAVRRPLW